MKPGLLLLGGGLLSCAAPMAPTPVRPEPDAVPLRDTSGDFLATAREPLTETAAPPGERWRTRTIEEPSPPPSHGRLIDLDVRDADVQEVCRLLADVGQVNIVVADDVHGTVTVRMKRVPWDQALLAIVEAKGLRAVHQGNIILVKPAGK